MHEELVVIVYGETGVTLMPSASFVLFVLFVLLVSSW